MKPGLARAAVVLMAASLFVVTTSGGALAASGSSWARSYCPASDTLKKVLKAETAKVVNGFAGVTPTSPDLTKPAAVLRTSITKTARAFARVERALERSGAPRGVKDGKAFQKALLAATSDVGSQLEAAKAQLAKFDPTDAQQTSAELSGAVNGFQGALTTWDQARFATLQPVIDNNRKFALLVLRACKSSAP